jgi:hypothetical protein
VAYNGTLNTNPIPTTLSIGAKIRSATLVDSYWQGKMDDLGLWTRGLTADEILAIYAAGVNGQPLTDAAIGDVAPIITTQPSSQTVAEGSTVSFSVSAAGTAPLSYQWRKDGQDIPGATSSVLQLTNTTLCAADGGEFSVLVCNTIDCAVSDAPAVLSVTPVAVIPITNGLFAHWTFDETSGTTAANSFGAADNGILNNYLPGDNSQWVPGRIGGALNFGGSAAGHYVSVATYPKPTTAMSASAWVWADARPTWATIVKNWGGATAGQFHFGLQDTGGDLSNFLQTRSGAAPNTREGAATPLPTNSWQHVAFTADGTTMRLYRNGIQVGSVTYSGDLAISIMAQLGIGVKLNDAGTAPDTGSPGYWQGKIDDLGLWSRALNGNEVRSIYNAGTQGLNLESASVLPSLQIVRTGDTATLSWPALPLGNCFALESSDTLPATSWTPAGSATLSGGRYSIAVSTASGNRFYQLRKQ